MLVDLNTQEGAIFETPFDVCISGTGPAGMPLALKLAEKGHRVLLLEAGDLTFTETSNNVYKGTNTGLDYFPSHASRQRFFGGTSNHWGGWCPSLSEHDFKPRVYKPHSGWPIKKRDLDPYSAETAIILDIETPHVPDYLQLDGKDPNLKKIDFSYSTPATRFGTKYRKTIESSDTITCVLNANVVDINLDENAESVSSLAVSNYTGSTFEARAYHFVLCHGGIENPRTLLNANRQVKNGIGNQRDLVGRFFMEHPHYKVARALLNHEHPAFAQYAEKPLSELPVAFYEPTPGFQDAAKVLNFGLRFAPRQGMFTPADNNSFKDRLKRFVCESESLLSLADDLKDEKRFKCPFDMTFKAASEQSPNPASRITLGEDTDRFGNRRVNIDWQLTELDKRTLRQSALEAGRVMAQKDLGRVRLSDWLIDSTLSFPDTSHDEVGGYHHMGTTRMAASPEDGVVSKNLQVFGIRNLYIGGSSVFPTCGHANPTFTIVQLSLRLADHIDNRISVS